MQCVSSAFGKAIYTRTGDDIGKAFPDVLENTQFNAVIDGELIIQKNGEVQSFNDLQKRLNRKTPTKKLIEELPALRSLPTE